MRQRNFTDLLTVRVAPDDWQRLARLAQMHDTTISEVVRGLIGEGTQFDRVTTGSPAAHREMATARHDGLEVRHADEY